MIKYKVLSIFGNNNNPHDTSRIFGFLGTLVIWIVLFICFILIKPVKQEIKKYKEVQIVFDAPVPAVEEPVIEEKPEEIQEELIDELIEEPVPVEEKVIEEITTEPEENTQKMIQEETVEKEDIAIAEASIKTDIAQKQESSKKNYNVKESIPEVSESLKTEEPAKAPEVIKKSETTESSADKTDNIPVQKEKVPEKPPKKEIDWDSMFAPVDTPSNTSKNKSPRKVTTSNSSSGTAGNKIDKNNNSSSLTSKNKNTNTYTGNEQASGETREFLGEIARTETISGGIGYSGEEGSSEVSVSGGWGNGIFFMKMNDGGARYLIKPDKPSIDLSEEAALNIDVSKTVTITFTVLQNGTVPFNKIEIKPSIALSKVVQEEIKNQISSWIFEESSVTSTGKFEYKIVKNK